MKILALDLGKNKSVYLDYHTGGDGAASGGDGAASGEAERNFGKIGANAREVEKLLLRCVPDRLVIEAGPAAGWICDLAGKLKIPVQVANCNDERWRWEASAGTPEQLWLFQVDCELRQLEFVQQQIEQVEQKLQTLAEARESVKRLRTAPCVGPRLSEAVAAILDDPHRFKSGRQVACYAGLTPRRWQSGQSDRSGHISHAGNRLPRELLVEIAWQGVRRKTWMPEVYEQVRRGSDKRKKIAIVAVARRLLVKLWAMMRDGTEWKEPALSAASTT